MNPSAYACGSGGAIFVYEEIEGTMSNIIINTASANDDDQE